MDRPAPVAAALTPVISDLDIRLARSSDVDQIALAHGDSIRSIGSRFYPRDVVDAWQEGLTRRLYLDAMKRGEVFFIATGTVEGTPLVLGFASDYQIEGSRHGASVYVRGIAARRGIGSALFRAAEAHAVARGASSIEIEASLAGEEFYRLHGFVEIGRGETRLTSGHPIACIFMRKDLIGHPPSLG
jgi:GNAT superfamily N-acetyltransferase